MIVMMMMIMKVLLIVFGIFVIMSFQFLVFVLIIVEINGNKYILLYLGQIVINVIGFLIVKGFNGVFIWLIILDKDIVIFEVIYVFDCNVGVNLIVGDIIFLDVKVFEYWLSNVYFYLIELFIFKNVQVFFSGNKVKVLVIGKDIIDFFNIQFSLLDGGDIYNVFNGVVNIFEVNFVLEFKKFGLDFWESLSGELVIV